MIHKKEKTTRVWKIPYLIKNLYLKSRKPLTTQE
jgi:hypothetical protein